MRALLFGLALTLTGCMAGPRGRPAETAAQRSEIDELEARIERERAALAALEPAACAERCPSVEAICEAAGRICEIAADVTEAAPRCERARAACTTAREGTDPSCACSSSAMMEAP